MSELTRLQAEKITKYLLTYHPWEKKWVDVEDTVFSDIQRILDETQSMPPLAPFVWHDATPENCARIPPIEYKIDGNPSSIKVAVKLNDDSADWFDNFWIYGRGWLYSYTGTRKVSYFMLIE